MSWEVRGNSLFKTIVPAFKLTKLGWVSSLNKNSGALDITKLDTSNNTGVIILAVLEKGSNFDPLSYNLN